MNRVRLVGLLGAEPELVKGILKLRVHTTDDDEWHRVAMGGAQAASMATCLHKGDTIVVEGRLRTLKYEKNGETRYSTDVVAARVFRTVARTG